LAIDCLYIASEFLSLGPLNTTLADCYGELYLNNRALLFTGIIVGPVQLAIHPCSKAIESPIFSKKEIVMPAS
jgi:hypothetical protein